MNGPRKEALEIRQGGSNPATRRRRPEGRALRELLLERKLKPAAQLRGGLARERDRRHPLDLVRAGRDAGRHPPRHLVGLPRPGAGLHEQIRSRSETMRSRAL